MSDTRTHEDDEGGSLLGDLLRASGFIVVSHAILREEPEALRAAVLEICNAGAADAIVITGGTGIAPRDRTIEALAPMFQKTLDGFGEAFRRLSWDQIGANAVLSRATAGVIEGRVVAALPGSPKAIRLAVEQILGPTLAHAVGLASGRDGGRHHHGSRHHRRSSGHDGGDA
jgi:molybdenum cofactor biosynthesis protein B